MYQPLKPLSENKRNLNKLTYIDSADKVINKTEKFNGVEVVKSYRLGILKPIKTNPDDCEITIISYDYRPRQLTKLLDKLYYTADRKDSVIAVDIETKGTKAHDPNCQIVGIGLANQHMAIYIDLVSCGVELKSALYEWLYYCPAGLVGHNIYFDAAFLLREVGVWLNWIGCTYGMYKQLANEGFFGQSWGLKAAQVELLGWEEKGDVELNEWLCRAGYIKSSSVNRKNKDQVFIETNNGPRFCAADKAEMWRAPADIIGKYCCLDAHSTWLLFVQVMLSSIEEHNWANNYTYFHKVVFINNVKLLVEQQFSGITIDRPRLEKHLAQLDQDINKSLAEFYEMETVKSFLLTKGLAYNQMRAEKEPAIKVTKSGNISKAYQKWQDSLSYIPSNQELFNLNSGPQLIEFFYNHVGYEVPCYTDSGQPSTGADAIPFLGDEGKKLKEIKELEKEKGYVTKCLEMLYEDENGNYRIHPQFRVPGTLTGRLSGSGGLNIQQLTKSPGYLECWRPVKGKVWIDFDIKSLEQVVLAEASEDKTLMKLYGPGANPNHDVYLTNGANMPIIGPKIRAAGYDPDSPTKEGMENAKKVCKNERKIAKLITLGASYGAGAKTIKESLKREGISVSDEDSFALHQGYWKLYSGVKSYEQKLLNQYKLNNGFVLNPLGLPVCCDKQKIKDIVNRCVQSSGHQLLMLVISYLSEHRDFWWAPVIIDYHDELIVEVNEGDESKMIKLISDAFDYLNNNLKGLTTLDKDGGPIYSLAEAKIDLKELETYRSEFGSGETED